jgi:hypothetical protein
LGPAYICTAPILVGQTLVNESVAFPELESLKARMIDFLSDKFIFFN